VEVTRSCKPSGVDFDRRNLTLHGGHELGHRTGAWRADLIIAESPVHRRRGEGERTYTLQPDGPIATSEVAQVGCCLVDCRATQPKRELLSRSVPPQPGGDLPQRRRASSKDRLDLGEMIVVVPGDLLDAHGEVAEAVTVRWKDFVGVEDGHLLQ